MIAVAGVIRRESGEIVISRSIIATRTIVVIDAIVAVTKSKAKVQAGSIQFSVWFYTAVLGVVDFGIDMIFD